MWTTRRDWLISCFLCALVIPGCASAPGSHEPGASTGSRSTDVITQEELADPSLVGSSIVNAIRRLRPRFLNDRGAGFKGEDQSVRVSIDGSTPMSLRELDRMDLAEITEIRYLSMADASLRFGLQGNMGPVLLVSVKARPAPEK